MEHRALQLAVHVSVEFTRIDLVVAAPEFTTDANRGVDAYQALKLRIHDEVRDRNRDNPFSSLVRVGSR